jgi:hypothetical protein
MLMMAMLMPPLLLLSLSGAAIVLLFSLCFSLEVDGSSSEDLDLKNNGFSGP